MRVECELSRKNNIDDEDSPFVSAPLEGFMVVNSLENCGCYHDTMGI